MPRSLPLRALASASLVLFLGGCAVSPRFTTSTTPSRGTLITSEQIEHSGATNAWEALRRLAPQLSLSETRSGEPVGMTRRGRDSFYLRQDPLVVIDGTAMLDFRPLYSIRARDIHSMRIMSGNEATTYYGLRGASGAIMLQTRHADGP
jgi:hypothetical protein